MAFAVHLPTDVPTYLTWGWLSVSVPNLIMILVTLALLVLAVLLPFPRDRRDSRDDS